MKEITLGITGTCSNNRGYSGAVPTLTDLKTNSRSKVGSLLVLLIFGLAMLMPSGINAQNPPPLPDEKSCVAQDLLIVDARLDIDACFQCKIGDPAVPFNLVLEIDNKTGSFRPTFAFWATLEVTEPGANPGDPDIVTTSLISGCDDTTGLPDKTLTELTFQEISYKCGSTLKLTDIFIAYTDASKPQDNKGNYDPNHKNSCPEITTKLTSKGKLDIAPKCGTQDEIVIDTPLDVTIDDEVICEGQSVTLTANATGGGGEYSYSWTPGGETSSSIEVSPGVDTDYTVTVTAQSIFDPNEICEAEFTATVTVNPANDAGDDGDLTVCSDDIDNYSLFDELGGTPQTGGTWTAPGGGDFGDGTFNASTDAEGTYTYTVDADGNGPCEEASADVVVTINPANDAGEDGDLTVCDSDDTDYSLFDELGGTPQTGGTWTAPGGGDFGDGTFNASTDAEGTYTYTVDADGNGPCEEASADVVVTINPANDAGEDGDLTVCSDDIDNYSLFDELGGTPQTGGTWTAPGGGDFGDGTFNASTDAEGTYTYTVDADGDGPCEEASADVVVTINPANDAGEDGDLTVCDSDDTDYSLFDELGGTPQTGGTWTAPGGGDFGDGTFNASTDAEGTYTYTVDADGDGPCEEASAEVVVTITPANDAGDDGDLTVCSDDIDNYSLFDELGGTPQTGGTWTAPGGGDFGDGTFNASTDAEGTYTYTVDADGDGPCEEASADVVVTINPANDAGEDGDLTVCDSDDTDYSLFDELGGTPQTGGTWTAPGGGDFGDGTFNASTDAEGTYTYTVDADGDGPCEEASAEVVVTITPANDAGDDGDLTVCSDDIDNYSLFDELGGTPQTGGTWTAPGGGDFGDGTFNASTDAEGTYTYTVDADGNGPCEEASADVVVTINPANDAGEDGDLTVCDSDDTDYSLFDELGGTPQTGGTWTAPGGGDFGDGTFNASTDAEGTYTYTVDADGNGPCEEASADVVVTINPANDAGEDGDLTVCSDDIDNYSLFDELGGTPQTGGTWTAPGGGDFGDGTFNASTDAEGTYTYTVDADGDGPCEEASADVVVTIIPLPEIPEIETQLADCIGGDGSFIFLGNPQNLYISFDDGVTFDLYEGAISLPVGMHDFVINFGNDGCISEPGQVDIQQLPATNFPLNPTIIQPDCDTGLGNVVIRVGINTDIDTGFFTYKITSGETVYYEEKQTLAGFDLPPGNYVVFGISDNGCDSGRTEITLEEPICEIFEGCTLGYWKNHTNQWSCYSTCTLYSEVFGDDIPNELQGKTLLQVLNLGGGGVYNLGRQSVAALLNICNIDVDYEILTEAELIAYVQDNFSNAGAAGSYLDELNNAGCTLGGSKATSEPSEGCDEPEDTRPGKGKPAKNSSSVTSGFIASPVPFKENLTIQYDFEYTSNVTIQVYDLRGQLLRSYKDSRVTKGDVTELDVDFRMKANQVYILRVATDRDVFSKSVISAKR